MTLSAGTRLGPYEILSLIGAGGMGEVYKARDTRLDRTVAIKVLPADISTDPDRRARFEREAKTIAGLVHPHICTLHDIGELTSTGAAEALRFLVMEHLAGETLAHCLEKGPLPIEQALSIATEIADALAAAHRQGIIHRDLKPANVMLTKDGAKLLDFGLAKLRRQDGVRLVADSSAATRTRDVTTAGTLVGTLPYMAPEQVEGREADARSDIWALGCVLYEMVTGQRAFEGATAGSLVGAILAKEPAPLATWRPLTPPALERLVRHCLAKDPERRWDSAHDVADELRWILETCRVSIPAAIGPVRRTGLWPTLLVGGVLAGAMVGAAAMLLVRPSAPGMLLTHASLEVFPADELHAGGLQSVFLPTPGGSRTALTWTPDGRALVYVGRRAGVQQLYARRLDAGEARALQGTEGAQVPAVSADGEWIAFWADGAIRKLPIGGGPVTEVAPGIVEPPCGLAWGDRGRLYFGVVNGAIWTIPTDGPPTSVTTIGEADVSHGLPWPLPGERALLYTVRKRVWSWGDEEVVAHTLATGERKVLLKDATDARYVPTGHLVFLRRGKLFAVPFDPQQLEVRGSPVAMLDTVAQALTAANAGDLTGAGQFAISPRGTLASVPSSVKPFRDGALVSVDRGGQVTTLPAPVRSYGRVLRLSSGSRRLAVTLYDLTQNGLWIYDLARGTLSPVTREGEVTCPTWSRDGQRLLFGWLMGGRRSVAAQSADGTGPLSLVSPGALYPSSLTPDGREIVAVRGVDGIVLVAAENGGAGVRPLVETADIERSPDLSPDGNLLAYESNVSGRFEIYVRTLAGPGPITQISIEGGQSPAWHPSGREIFFVGERDAAGKRRMMAAEFAAGSPPRIGRPRALFEFDPRALTFACIPVRCYDVAADGQQFYAIQQRSGSPPVVVTHVDLVMNWFDELKAKVPEK